LLPRAGKSAYHESVTSFHLAIAAALCVLGASLAAAPPGPYTAVEVDPFPAARGVTFPSQDQTALVDDIAREVSVEYPTVVILRLGDPANGLAVLRISGVVTEFNPGNGTKRALFGFGGVSLRAQVSFQDAGSGRLLFQREFAGSAPPGGDGGDSRGADDRLAKKIAKICSAAHMIASR
jgi:hypothetical protein